MMSVRSCELSDCLKKTMSRAMLTVCLPGQLFGLQITPMHIFYMEHRLCRGYGNTVQRKRHIVEEEEATAESHAPSVVYPHRLDHTRIVEST